MGRKSWKGGRNRFFCGTGRYRRKKVAITFDDGPNPDYTEELLTGLKERGVNATFFLLGKEVEKYPEIVKDISDGGHLIGTHSYEHVNLSNLPMRRRSSRWIRQTRLSMISPGNTRST